MSRPSTPLWTPRPTRSVAAPLSRRSLLRGAAVGGSLVVLPGLSACSDRGSSPTESSGGGGEAPASSSSSSLLTLGIDVNCPYGLAG